MNIYGKQSILRAIDPHLGYNYLTGVDLKLQENESFCNGYVRIGDDKDNRYKVGILGGSTSDISLNGSWIRFFYERMNSLVPTTLYSGAVSGYSSSQEVIKLIRDLLPLDCNLIISLNGVNDLGFLQSTSPLHPMVHHHQKISAEFLLGRGQTGSKFFDNESAALKGKLRILSDSNEAESINYGTRYNSTPADLWLRNVKIMNSICGTFGINYVCFLQPTFGVGRYNSTTVENESFSQFCSERKYNYKELLSNFYDIARQYVKITDCNIHDLVDCFGDLSMVYSDPRHPNEDGNRHLADMIFQYCRRYTC